ncbi:MAG: glycoside hydrolase family 99-like domain-containing protein [Nitrosospira multiformis]|nr:glycoside hydrolase family 99-like domain-containing protein [Nitrosospira multiformis]
MSTNKVHKYEYEVDVTSNTAAAYVAAMVGREKQVLEIGPGPGSITKVLQSVNACHITGIELDGEAIEKLIPYCDRIIQVDLNSIDWQKLLVDIGRFDVVVAADVLEHLYDPWSALQNIVQFLSPDGYAVVSLPHIGHGAIMSCLLNDDFEYREWGLLDRTHIRFFGLRNIEELFAQAGLKIIEACYVIKPPEETEFASDWSRLSGPVQDLIMNNPHAQVYQVVVKAVLANHEGEPVSLTAPQHKFKRGLSRQSDVPKEMNEAVGKETAQTEHAIQKSHMEPATGQLSTNHLNPRLIAFFLPQFHPIPENDQWWGRGFTEWTNVTKAEPLFEGHLQPHLPTDSGFYDLRLRETRRDQIRMAKEYGIDAFCYHYYWFSGKRLLNFPIDDMLADRESDMPFCLCWANENWTRRWDAGNKEILIAQEYLPDDDINFIKSLQPFFEDKRYLRVDDKPFLIVYRPQHLQDPAKTASIWRNYCRQIGIGEIHLCAALTHGNESYSQFAFDSGVEFPPHNFRSETVNHLVRTYHAFHGTIAQYATVAESYLARSYNEPRIFKTVFPSWDNTARTKERALIILNGTPENYEHWLASTIDAIGEDRKSEHLVFINAWNEWAEGCHLEPDRWFSHRFLQATRNAKAGLRRYVAFPHVSTPAIEEEPLHDQSSETEVLRDEIDAARAEIDMMREELEALYRSTSWRITAPLRSTRRLITRLHTYGILPLFNIDMRHKD